MPENKNETSENTNKKQEAIIPPKYPTTLSEIGTFLGREEVRTTTRRITPENVCNVLNKVLPTFQRNQRDIEYLYNYYLGVQPILSRVKTVRADINNKTVENHAEEIVSFFTGYIFGDPIVYAGRSEGDCSEEITELNAWNAENDKEAQDVELGTWMHICGTGFKMALPVRDSNVQDEEMSSPYITTVLDPREAFVVYYNGIQKIPVMGVKIIDTRNTDVDYTQLYCVYTEDSYYEIPNTMLYSGYVPYRMPNPIGAVPIIEYPLNLSRRGRIEPVIPLMDALNILQSNRLDGIEQYIQSLILFRNVDVSAEDVEKLSAMGAIKFKDVDPSTPGDVRYLTAELNQEGAQTLKEDLYKSLLIICGMPNRNTGNGDNGVAVVYRDGWSAAETKAKETEKFYTRSERNLLRVVLRILRGVRGFNVHLSNIEVCFTRRNYENTQSKAQVLTTMLGSEKIAPRLAFVYSGLFSDPEAAYQESEQYYEEQQRLSQENVKDIPETGNDTDNREDS